MSVVTTLRDAVFRSYLESVLSVSVKDLNKLLILLKSMCLLLQSPYFSPWFAFLVKVYYGQDTYRHPTYSGKRVQLAPQK
jgi:hypothetical protein